MRASSRRVDQRSSARAVSRVVNRSTYRFIGGKDASKLALVLMRVRSGRRPTAKQLDALSFDDPVARKAAAGIVKSTAKRRRANPKQQPRETRPATTR
jgi:hypothetical protein